MTQAELHLRALRKVFFNLKTNREFIAVENFSLAVKPGEFISILGPSGSGKTTILRMIAGLETPTSGEIYFGERLMNAVPAYKRNFVMMFQNPSLFPHLTIEQNIAYGLKVRKIDREIIEAKVSRMLEMTELTEMRKKMPNELSGGEQQRVSLARAMIVGPEVLLLDEPLAHLDTPLRKNLRAQIRNLQVNTKTTTLFVTHDESEANEISDRIVRVDKS